MEKSLSYQARRALLQQTVPQYREASPSQKKTLLDAFVAATGYHRTYARWLLNHAEEVQQILHRPRPRQYGPEVQHALFQKIRAHLLQTREEQWQAEVIRGPSLPPISADARPTGSS